MYVVCCSILLCPCFFFFFNDTATTEIYTLSLHDALPILTWQEPLPPAKFVFADEERMGHALDSMVGAGVVVSGGEVLRSVLSPNVHIHSYAKVSDSVLMPGAEVGREAVVRDRKRVA